MIVIKKMSKIYGNGKVAVNNLSLGIHYGECFGLLGINGMFSLYRGNTAHIVKY
jgi:ATP-binding cassette, subfamily A (ABC1), member 3